MKKDHNRKTITTFASFEEMENHQLKYFASLKPDQLLQNLRKMLMAAFGINDQQSIDLMPKKIRFKK